MLAVKRLLIASIVIAVAALLLRISFTHSTGQAAGERKAQEKSAPARTESSGGAVPSIEKIPWAGRSNIGVPGPQDSESTAMLNVPGFPSILLGSRSSAPWEKTIDAIADRTDLADAVKARFLITMLAGLPEEALTKAAEEAVVRLPDSDYRAVVMPTLVNPQTHGLAMSVLFADLMERPGSISMPILLAIAKDARHPYAPFARENLELLLDRDFGSDWTKWDAAIRERLRSQGR